MTTLRAATESCIRSFAVVCHATEDIRSASSCCDDVKEEFGRFRIWTGNLGALAKGHSALDWRLRDANVMRSTVLSLLEELRNTLELGISAVASDLVLHGSSEAFLGAEPTDDDLPDDISLPSDDEFDAISPSEDSLSYLTQRIQEQVKDLYKLSFRIRNSTSKPARAIHYKEIDATFGLDIFGDCFASFDKNHVSELFKSLRPKHSSFNENDNLLVQRFAKANTARRRQFRYWQKHAQKLTYTDIAEPDPVVIKAAALETKPHQAPLEAQATLKPMSGIQPSQSHHGRTIFTTTEATFFDPKLDLTSLETQSVISSATTARDLEGKPAELPPPPAAALDGEDFVCPYCFVLCPSTHGQGRAWSHTYVPKSTALLQINYLDPDANVSGLGRDHSFQVILDWLSPDAFSEPLSRSVSSVDSTLWGRFITGEEYRTWLAGDPLWRVYCCGSHLSRLSTFVSNIHAQLEKTLPSHSAVVTLFMPESTQTDLPQDFLASLVGQLLVRLRRQLGIEDVPQTVMDLLLKSAFGGPPPSAQIIKEVLGQLLACFTRVYIILDNVGNHWDNGALPLWTVIMGPRFANLSLMLTMQTFQNPSMTTSCSVCGKEELILYWHCTTCKDGDFDACITCHTDGLGCQSPSHRSVLTDVQKEKTVVDVDSFYLHATPNNSFARQIDLELLAINQRNLSKTKSEEILIAQYDDIFDIITSSEHPPLATKALDIVYHACRTLTIVEFLDVINISQESSVIEMSQVATWTGDLIKASKDEDGIDRVRFFDESLTRYLRRKKDQLFPLGHLSLAVACLQVLLSQRVPPEAVIGQSSELSLAYWSSELRAANSLYSYAACAWGQHLRACSSSPAIEDMAMQYLEDKDRFKMGTMTAFVLQPEDMAYGFDIGHDLAAVHVCSIFGLTNLLRRLPSTEYNRSAPVSGRTPLLYACSMGHADTVDMLLDSGARFDLESDANTAFVVLQEAVKSRHLPVVKALLRSPLVGLTPTEPRDSETVSFLVSILQLRSISILKLTLARNEFDINSKDNNGRTALWWLLSTIPDSNAPDYQTNAAAIILQQPHLDVNAIDLGGRTYVMRLINTRIVDLRLIDLLLKRGAELDVRDEEGETALFHAVTLRYSLEMTAVLVTNGADLTITNHRGQGLLHRIVTSIEGLQDLQYLDLLVKKMPTLINAQDSRGRTPLHLALVLGKVDIARGLLARAVSVNVLDKFGRAPFDVACQYGRTLVLPSLEPVGLYRLDPKNEARQTDRVPLVPQSAPIHLVLREEHSLPGPPELRRAQSDLDLYADLQHTTTLQQNRQEQGIISLTPGEVLLEMQLNKLPAWSLAFLGRYDKLLEGLQKNTITPLEQSPDDGNTALHTVFKQASMSPLQKTTSRGQALKALLAKVGTNCSPQNVYRETPLHSAIAATKPELAIMLIEAGANLGMRDNLDRTPLEFAEELGQDAIVTAVKKAFSEKAQHQPGNVLMPAADDTISSIVPIKSLTDLSAQGSYGPEKDQVVDWLKSFTDLRTLNVSSTPLNALKYQQLLRASEFRSWCTGVLPQRLVCFGLDNGRLTKFTSAVYNYLTRNLPETPTVLCHIPRTCPEDLEARDILAFMLGQLIAYETAETISTELLELYAQFKASGQKPTQTTLDHLLRLSVLKHARVLLILDGVLGQEITQQIHSTVADLSPIKILLSTTHHPISEIICDRCDKRTSRYWHCSICNRGDFDLCWTCKYQGLGCLQTLHKMIAFDASTDQATIAVDEVFEIDHPTRDLSKDVATRILDLHKIHLTETEQQPPFLDKVYSIYHNTINSAIVDSEHEFLAMISFEIVSHATRPLSSTEFEHALHTIRQIRGLQSDNNWNIAGAIMATGHLIMVQNDSVCFFQTSLLTYLEKSQDRWFPEGHAEMAAACLTSLMPRNPHTSIDAQQAASTLFAYAASAWGPHVRACAANRDIEMLAFKYLTKTDHLQAGNRVAHEMRAPGFDVESGIGPLHVCAIFGLTSLLYRVWKTPSGAGAEIDSRNPTHMKTPLMYAAAVGHLDTVILLLELGASPYLTNAEGFTAMFEALKHDRHDVLMHFLRSTAIRPYTMTHGDTRHTALMHIPYFTSIESVRALLDRRDIDINESDSEGRTVLSYLIVDLTPHQPGWTDDVARLILEVPGFDIRALDKTNRSYIQQLLDSPNFSEDLLKTLLDSGIDFENQDDLGETAIFYAICQQPTTNAARMLFDRGANMFARNYADTGLMHRIGYYSETDQIIRVKALLQLAPGLIDDQDSMGRTALHRALFLGHMQLARTLLTFNPDIEIPDNHRRTAFDVACQYGRVPMAPYDDVNRPPSIVSGPSQRTLSDARTLAQRLTPKGPTSWHRLPAWSLAYSWELEQLRQRVWDNKLEMLEMSPDNSNTALHYLMRLNPGTTEEQKEVLEVYFERSDECNPRNNRQETPLHIAIQEDNVEMAEVLMRNGADLEARESSGKTPLNLAKALERSTITTLIRQALREDVDVQESSEDEELQ
ncbi:hypothetical protein KCU65_g2601, partial [Aureobasidium melanogenum]